MAATAHADIRDIEDAWGLFTRVLQNVFLLEARATSIESASIDDLTLAEFVKEHPRVFEERLISRLPELAQTHISDRKEMSALDAFREAIWGSEAMEKTLEAFDPVKGLELCRLMVWRYESEGFAFEAAQRFFGRLAHASAPPDLPPESCDVIRWWRPGVNTMLSPDDLPEVLPWDLEGWSPADIEAAIERYVGVPIDVFAARLRPSGGCTGRLGTSIWSDACKLRALGVARQTLAARLDMAVRYTRGHFTTKVTLDEQGGVTVNATRTSGPFGYDYSPLHSLRSPDSSLRSRLRTRQSIPP
ncbi:MAG: hypothetical protein R3B70_20845 [Polyangiaceae bacterium]